jgi:hypothetical protein
MIADGVVGRVQICKHAETHANTLSQSNLDDCHLYNNKRSVITTTSICRIIKTLTAALAQQRICVITTTSIPMYAGSSSNP